MQQSVKDGLSLANLTEDNAWFESPLVYAPFLPIIMVKGISTNVFNRRTGVAHSAAVDTIVPEFCAEIEITNMTP